MVLDSVKAPISTAYPNNKRFPNRSLRAVSKSSIEIPDANTLAKDFKQCGSRSHDKYIMQNVILMENPPKRRRGRPRKVLKPQSLPEKVGFSGLENGSEEEDLADLADPSLVSDNEDDKVTAALPNITRSRSGRVIKMKKEDGDFKYYDIPGQEITEHEDLGSQTEGKDESSHNRLKGKHRRKRKFADTEKPVEQMPCNIVDGDNLLANTSTKDSVGCDKRDNLKIEVSEVEEGMSMPLITRHIEEACDQVGSSKCVDHSCDSDGCLLCIKSFNTTHDHLTNVVTQPSDILNAASDDIPEKLLSNDVAEEKIVDKSGFELSKDVSKESDCREEFMESEIIHQEPENTLEHESQDSLFCSICNISFPTEEELKTHSHSSLFECHFCQKKYQNRMNLQTHMKKYHEDTEWMKYKCATCGKSFGFLLALERHMKEHNPNQKFCCEQCGKVFKNLANLKNHIPLHTKDEVFECPYCPKQYYLKYSYEKHIKNHDSTPQFYCDVCDSKFTERAHFKLHQERHQSSGSHGRSKDYKCNNCGDIKTQSEIDLVGIADVGHHKTCIACGKGFYKKYRYIVEKQVENQDGVTSAARDERQREQCKWCGKYVLNLSRHIKNTHLGNDYVSCELCGMVVTKWSLPSHKNRKHGGSRVTCDHCNQTFKNVMCLREHMAKVRRKEDPSKNVCKFCKEVVNAENWKDHMAKHKSKCSDCGAAHFSTHDEFLAHLDSCRRCSNCNLSTFESREEFLNHIEICSSGINIITSSLDAASEQEVVTSIFAIVDSNTCELCGFIASDSESLAQHIASDHPEVIPGDHMFGDGNMISEDILYACPKDSCGAILTSKSLLKSHMSSVHNIAVRDEDSSDVSHSQELEFGGRKFVYNPSY